MFLMERDCRNCGAVIRSSLSGSTARVKLPNDRIQQIMVNGKPLKQSGFKLKSGTWSVRIELEGI